MSIRKVVAGLLITAGIAIMAVPFFWRTTGEKQTNQLMNQFEQTLEDDRDEETDVEEEQTSISILTLQLQTIFFQKKIINTHCCNSILISGYVHNIFNQNNFLK